MNTSVNNILNSLNANAALREFKLNEMETDTTLGIIQATENAPFTLNKLSEEFLTVESVFNSTVNRLKDEKTEIELAYKNALAFTQNQQKQQILDKETALLNGSYFPDVLQEYYDKWLNEKTIFTILKWGSIVLGVYVLFAVKWYTGIFIGGIGLWIFSVLVSKTEEKINKVGTHLKTTLLNQEIQNSLHKVSDSLNIALNKAEIEFKEEIDVLRNKLNEEYEKKEKAERKLLENRLQEFELKEQSEMTLLRSNTNNNIQNNKLLLNKLVSLLNKLPETYNSNSLSWNADTVLKGKELVASNIRVGNEHLQISIEGTQHSVDVPRCVPFLNKSNLVFNCKNATDTKEAIRISHNIIARTLLGLPASKTKITFIDPLELGGNAAPFTPLLREIYGGMVFTQQNDIENQLAILTRAIENVIQKYLQDKFADIADYNLKTKEVPEPYRLLVVYNFPHGFNETTANKLLNIIKSGPKSGVHTILINDRNAKLPYGISWNTYQLSNIVEVFIDNFDPLSKVQININKTFDLIFNLNKGYTDSMLDEIAKYLGNHPNEVKKFGSNEVDILKNIKAVIYLSQEKVDGYHGVIPIKSKCNIIDMIPDIKYFLYKGIDIEIVENFESKNAIENSISLSHELVNDSKRRHFQFDKDLPYGEIVDYINKELPNVSSIKVPFTKYIAPQTEWWQEKAHKRFTVPIGRHALEVQNLKFDNEDDNQALLIGKPGSGKSNLLHVIIANSIWKYSPDQLEIYLIDFKGGVEFTIYADKKIPHIRTIAIESEREFGLSVLDGVERELLRRETEFSKVGVQNIEQYHEKFPNERMPRVLLIVDEFQEFFAEDDNIKQAVDDKFDRIVRKGRAFGINTLFSSQTLSGNSIKKSTKELIDIRIALMCSDLDSNQILDDRNPAARDLTRPGEGIYNPENGKVEGNRRFQAFFIEKDDLNKTIESVVSFAKANPNGHSKFKQIIFRGSEKAIMEKENHPLKKISAVTTPKSLRLWVGEPVAIADDVTAVMRKQSGSNLLVAGYDENIGLRVMCSSIISIAAQQQPKSCKFYSFNFYNVDSEFVNVPDELFNNIDQDCMKVNGRQVKETLEAIKQEIENRLAGSSQSNSNIYLSFFSLQRGRAFRKDGYSMSDEGNLLSYILKEGADVGVFSLVQVDTMDNFSKNLDDNLLKEFSQRIASQMNPDNSVKVIGNQKAAKLGGNRAWYYDDNENTMIKFKPYELPSFTWIKEIKNPQSTLS